MHHPKHHSTGYIGWYGVIAILSAFALVILNPTTSSHWVYHLLNLSGSLAVGYDAYRQRNLQPVVLNIFWAIISVIGILRFLLT